MQQNDAQWLMFLYEDMKVIDSLFLLEIGI